MPQFICFLEPTRHDLPENPSAAETSAIDAHFAYYQKLLDRGSLHMAGRTHEPPYIGIMIYEAPTKEDAISIAAQDPAITKGVLKARVQTFQTALQAGAK
jgi:uncharacterized protein YciI